MTDLEELSQNVSEDVKKRNPQVFRQGNPLPTLAHLLAKHHKYNAQRTEYNGRFYPSKKEAQHAQDNDTRIKAGNLSFYLEQVPIRLPGNTVYRLDFLEFSLVANTHLYEIHFVEVKGYKTPLGELKRRQAEAIYGITIEVV